ncbi:MAG: hypothetical protein JXQ76_00525, partial [Campylobacterales bacterium]|nr:hypothetical protein [Campylobacterales bacterium]
MKKIGIALLVVLLALGGFFLYQSQDQFSQKDYTASMDKGLEKGSFIKFKLPNQYNQDFYLDATIAKIIVVSTKAQGHILNEFLATKPQDFLKSIYGVILINTTQMPVAIRNTFVLPSLRATGYPTAL